MSDLVTVLTRMVLVRFTLGQYDIVDFEDYQFSKLRRKNEIFSGLRLPLKVSKFPRGKKNNSRSLQFIGTVMVISNPVS